MKTVAELRADATTIFHGAVRAVDPVAAINKVVYLQGNRLQVEGRSYDLSCYERIIVVGAGKACAKMALAIEQILGQRVTSGVVNVKYGHGLALKTVQVIEAGHPVPDEAGVRGANQIATLLRGASDKDLVLCLISGGGSALMPCPVEGLTLEDKQKVTELLLKSGAPIHELNALRKNLSQLKGGRLARIAYPASVISLILSDVIGDDLGTIASGPTVPDKSRFSQCLEILEKYQLKQSVPINVLGFLEKMAREERGRAEEPADPAFSRTHNVIVGSNAIALEAARQKAEELGYGALILSSSVQGEAREVAGVHGAIAREILSSGHPISRPACVISGGETTVTIKGKGLGGRNQEFALAAGIHIAGLNPAAILCGGTDGTDGPTDAAGAIVDGSTIQRAEDAGLDAHHYLGQNDSYHFFENLGDLLKTGPTFTNVMDLNLILVG